MSATVHIPLGQSQTNVNATELTPADTDKYDRHASPMVNSTHT